MDLDIYFQGFLVTTTLLIIEHVTLYALLKPRGNANDTWRILVKFGLGVLAILIGSAAIAWLSHEPLAFLAPTAASMGGVVIALAYGGRWIVERIRKTAYTRGRLHGLADKADIAEERDGR